MILSLAVLLSAALGLTGGVPALRRNGWYAWWPAPIMVAGSLVGAVDLVALARSVRALSTPSLVLGVWAAVTVNFVGVVEIDSCRRGSSGGRALIAPAFLVAAGAAILSSSVRASPETRWPIFASGLLTVVAGLLLVAARVWRTDRLSLSLAWPIALVLATASAQITIRRPVDPFAEAYEEMVALAAAWANDGRRVTRMESPGPESPYEIGPVVSYQVDGNEVIVYLIAHDSPARAEAHLSPRLPVPPSRHGEPHVHRGSHILVVCVTDDWRFAQWLDDLVRALAGHGPGGSKFHNRPARG